MKKHTRTFALALAAAACLSTLSFASCGETGYVIALPNDTTNEARALLLLEEQGLITLKEGAGITATVRDIASNPYGLSFREIEAAQIPNVLPDVDYAVINSNYAIAAGISPKSDALATEGESAYLYANILAVKSGNESSAKIKALSAALQSQAVVDFINAEYDGAIVDVIENAGDGFDATVDYTLLNGTEISVAASPAPHADILEVAKTLLATKGITLKIVEYNDYILPNTVVADGELDANYFQHLPYLEDFNAQNKTDIVSVAAIHTEPLGVYGGKQKSLDAIKAGK